MDELVIRQSQGRKMLDHVLACLPEEACGLAVGKGSRVEEVFLVTNALHSPVRFRMDPQEQLDILLWIEDHSQELVAIFHSHTAGPAVPSPTDVEEFAYPGAAALIWSPVSGSWAARAFMIEDGTIREISIRWLDS